MQTYTHTQTTTHVLNITSHFNWTPTADEVAEFSAEVRKYTDSTEVTIDASGKVYDGFGTMILNIKSL
jgi:hypothetical protein